MVQVSRSREAELTAAIARAREALSHDTTPRRRDAPLVSSAFKDRPAEEQGGRAARREDRAIAKDAAR